MKKLLSIILALAMLVSMIPAAFAGDAEEPVSVTFSFINGGRSDVNQSSFETVKKIDDTTYTSVWTNYKNFPEDPKTPSENWAYAGNTVGGSVGANSYVNCTNYAGTGFVNAANQWIAFKVKMPKTATYRIEEMQTYKYKNSTASLEVYMFPSDERFTEGNAIYGKINPPASEDGYVTRSDMTTFDKLGITNPVCLGKGNGSANPAVYEAVTLTDKSDIELNAGEEYILLINNASNGKVITVKSVTFTEVTGEEPEEIIENPEFSFIKSAIKDTTITKIYDMKDPSKLNREISTGEWFAVSNPEIKNSAFASDGAQFCAYEAPSKSGSNALVLQINVDKAGVYSPTINFVKQAYCGLLEFYTVPVSVVENNGWSLDTYVTVNTIIDAAEKSGSGVEHIASIDTHTDSPETSPVIGATSYFAENNYLIIKIRNGCGVSTHKNKYYYGYLKSIKLEKADAKLELYAGKSGLKPGNTTTLSVAGFDTDGAATSVTDVTYTSSDSNIATVDPTTGVVTAIADGSVKMTANATVSGKVLTDEITLVVKTIWAPVFNFTSAAIANRTATGAVRMDTVNNHSVLDDNVSTGLWKYGSILALSSPAMYGSSVQFGIETADDLGKGNNALIITANIDKTNAYKPTITTIRNVNGGCINLYAVRKAYADANCDFATKSGIAKIVSECEAGTNDDMVYIGSADAFGTKNDENPVEGNTVVLSNGEYYFIMTISKGSGETTHEENRYYGLVKSISLDNVASIAVFADSKAIAKGDTTTLRSVVRNEYYEQIGNAEVTYESLNTSVATVSGSTVEAVAPGVATIKATATVDDVVVSDTVEITVGEETVEKTVSIATSIDGAKADVRSYARGAKVTVEAPEIEGKTFRHWVRGTVENGDWVSADAKYSFTATTHTYLTAVYTNEATGKLVEFFNGNGEYLSEAIADADGKVALPANPSITGYVFSKWLLDKDTEFTADTILTADVTRVVADFIDDNETYEVNGKEYKYGEEANFESDIDVVWYRNEKAVAYGKTYTYYVWDDAEIVCKEESAAPMVVLDKDVKSDNAYMIEYDACGKNIVEVGIIFGSGNHTVDSCDSKATSQRGLKRGQFTAKPGKNGAKVARGYLVYEENGAYKVVYSK